jgi:hypothetical protein
MVTKVYFTQFAKIWITKAIMISALLKSDGTPSNIGRIGNPTYARPAKFAV